MNARIARIILVATMAFGVFCVARSSLPNWYVALTAFIVLKMVFKYNKCTLSYFECKLRGVNKEQGYIYRILQSLMDLPVHLIVVSVIYTLGVCYVYFTQTESP